MSILMACAVVIVLPVTVGAASGLPPTVTLLPDPAGPGMAVDVSGLDFPASGEVRFHLITTERIVPLGATRASDTGTIRTSVTMPTDLPIGVWELRATGPDDAVAVRLFKAIEPPPPVDPAAAGEGDPAAEGTASHASTPASGGSDLLVILIVLGVLGAVVTAAVVAWRIVRRGDHQPGMPAGDDPIWSGVKGSRPQA